MAVDEAERADCGDLTPPAEQGPEGVLAVLLAGGRDAMVRRRQQADLLPARLASRVDVEHDPDAAVVVRASIPAAGEPRPAGRHHALLPQGQHELVVPGRVGAWEVPDHLAGEVDPDGVAVVVVARLADQLGGDQADRAAVWGAPAGRVLQGGLVVGFADDGLLPTGRDGGRCARVAAGTAGSASMWRPGLQGGPTGP